MQGECHESIFLLPNRFTSTLYILAQLSSSSGYNCNFHVDVFFPADVLSEEAILKWYTEAHVAKGRSVFLEQMKKFVEWLKNAEEGEHGLHFMLVR